MTPADVKAEVERQLEVIAEGAEQFVGAEELRQRLETAIREDRPLRVKLGLDPSAPDITLGHTVPLAKLRAFQELGHVPIFLVGDFTARIGDPSGRSRTRPALSAEQVRENAKTYVDQVSVILDVSRAEVRFNSEWMDEFGPDDFIRLCAHGTVARLLERDDFKGRYAAGDSISVHEFLYPFVQGYDSVALEADVELGGTDQTYNLLFGRDIQRAYGQAPQAILTLPLLVGLDGREKMSKSLGNYVGICEAPEEIYGKTMRISDELMLDWFDLLAGGEWEDLRPARQAVAGGGGDPMGLKQALAERIVARFHDAEAATRAALHFRKVVVQKGLPDEIPEREIRAGGGDLGILTLLVELQFAKSNSEARRLVSQGAVELDGQQVEDPTLKLAAGATYLVKVGKRRFARARVSA